MKLTHIAAGIAVACVATSANADRLVIKGSDTLGAKLIPQLAEQLKAQHPGTTFDSAAEVGKNKNGIGYVGLAYTKAGGIKVMPIDGSLPSVQTVHAKTYPYARPTFYYTNGEPSGVAKEFLDFTISAAGQRIAAQVG